MTGSFRIVVFAVLFVSQSAFAVPPLWESAYEQVLLNGTNGGAVSGLGPSGQTDGQENIALGFNFPFGGVNYNRISVDSDGAIVLKNTDTVTNIPPTTWTRNSFHANFTNQGNESAAPVISPFNTALTQSSTNGEVWYASYSGNFNGFNGARGVVTWERSALKVFDSTADITFQAILLGNGTIIFNYRTLTSPAGANWNTRAEAGIVVGVSNGDGTWPLGSQNWTGPEFGIDLTGYEVWCLNDNPGNPGDCIQAGLGKNSAFDLNDKSIVLNRDGNSGFYVSSSIKDGTGKGGSQNCAVVAKRVSQAGAPAIVETMQAMFNIAIEPTHEC